MNIVLNHIFKTTFNIIKKILFNFAILILLLATLCRPGYAQTSDTLLNPNASCDDSVSIINQLLIVVSLSFFGAASLASFDMTGAENSDERLAKLKESKFYNGQNKGCDIPSNDLWFKFRYLHEDGTYSSNQYEWSDGDSDFWVVPPTYIKVSTEGDKICAKLLTTLGYMTLGCKNTPPPSRENAAKACFVANTCTNDGITKISKTILPITGNVVACVKDTLATIFLDTKCACLDTQGSKPITSLPEFQNKMRNAVRAALILYVTLFGIKMAIGGAGSKNDIIMFFVKFILVTYFSVGFVTSQTACGAPAYDDGVSKIIQPFFTSATTELSNIIYEAAGSGSGTDQLCYFDPKDYSNDTVGDYRYLAMWDSLDCRILYYLGFSPDRIISMAGNLASAAAASGIISVLAPFLLPVVFILIIPALFSFQIIFFVFCLLFAIFLLSIVIFTVHFFIIAAILQTILIFLAPLFVPMALFNVTKSMYDGWLKLLISFTLQPMVITAFISIMLTMFDQTMFTDCSFKLASTLPPPFDRFQLWSIIPQDDPNLMSNCKNSMGYNLMKFADPSNSPLDNFSAIFFNIPILQADKVNSMLSAIITNLLFGFLFYKFSTLVGGIAADLTGGPNIGGYAIGPTAVFDKAMQVMKKAAVGAAKGTSDTGDNKKGDDKDGKERSADAGKENDGDKKKPDSMYGASNSGDSDKKSDDSGDKASSPPSLYSDKDNSGDKSDDSEK